MNIVKPRRYKGMHYYIPGTGPSLHSLTTMSEVVKSLFYRKEKKPEVQRTPTYDAHRVTVRASPPPELSDTKVQIETVSSLFKNLH